MEVKVCPQCDQENRSDRPFCSECKTSLVGVPTTQSAESAPSSTPGTAGPAFVERPSAAYRKGINWGAIVLVVLLICGAGFAGWWFLLKPSAPGAVVQKFLDATTTGDYDGFKACLCRKDVDSLTRTSGGEEAARKQMKETADKDGGAEIIKTTYENDGTLAVVEIRPYDQTKMPPGMARAEILLVDENGWKIDLESTGKRMLGRMLKGEPLGD